MSREYGLVSASASNRTDAVDRQAGFDRSESEALPESHRDLVAAAQRLQRVQGVPVTARISARRILSPSCRGTSCH